MLQNRKVSSKGSSLDVLENVFLIALQQKSKCLIQSCVIIAEQEFSGVMSFKRQTQVKFLLESIHHIVVDNCQKEYIHIVRYLEMVNTLCSDDCCQNEFLRLILKIKQLGKRTLSTIRREILSFRRLVDKLLTDMEFRQRYFFDDWFNEFGASFHEQLLSDVNVYLKKVEKTFITAEAYEEVIMSCMQPERTCDPATLYFVRLFTGEERDRVKEVEVLSFLKWMFPTFDETSVTLPTMGYLEIPEVLQKKPFKKIYSDLQGMSPWDHKDLHEACLAMETSKDNVLLPQRCDINSAEGTQDREKLGRIALGELNNNSTSVHPDDFIRDGKRKQDDENGEDTKVVVAKRKFKENSPSELGLDKHLLVDLGKENQLATNRTNSPARSRRNKQSYESPLCRNLLASGSKYFSSAGKSSLPKRSSVRLLNNFGNPRKIEFSDTEGNESNFHEATKESGGLSWICSNSSEDVISESDSDEMKEPVQSFCETLDSSYVPDLAYYLKGPKTQPCSVKLDRLSKVLTSNVISKYHISNDDMEVIKAEDRDFQFCCYSNISN